MPSTQSDTDFARDLAPEEAKAQLRVTVRKAREARTDTRREEDAIAIASHVLALPAVRDASCVSIYASRATEPGTFPLIESLADRGVRVLLPILGEGLQRGWSVFQGTDDLSERAPGRPPEPSGEFLPPETLAEADVVIVPALGVDRTGTRLGQGGGWYDRALPNASADAKLLALVYTDELRDAANPLPREDHDVPVSGVVTPDGLTSVPA